MIGLRSLPSALTLRESVSDFYVVFSLDDFTHALSVRFIDRVIRAVEITPAASDVSTLGVIVIHGKAVPVLDLRRCLGFGPKMIELDDHFLILSDGTNRVACPVDRVLEIRTIERANISSARASGVQSELIQGVAEFDGASLLIGDGAKIISQVFGMQPNAVQR